MSLEESENKKLSMGWLSRSYKEENVSCLNFGERPSKWEIVKIKVNSSFSEINRGLVIADSKSRGNISVDH